MTVLLNRYNIYNFKYIWFQIFSFFYQVKGSLQTFMRKLEMGGVVWPDVNENFSTLAGQLNFLQKVLTKEEVCIAVNST